MRKKLSILLVAAGTTGIMMFPGSPALAAACNDGTSQVRDPNTGAPTGADTLGTTPNGTTIYGDGAEENLNPGYLGATGSTGYIEISGNLDDRPNVQIDGADTGGRLEGRVGADTGAAQPADACVNGQEIA